MLKYNLGMTSEINKQLINKLKLEIGVKLQTEVRAFALAPRKSGHCMFILNKC